MAHLLKLKVSLFTLATIWLLTAEMAAYGGSVLKVCGCGMWGYGSVVNTVVLG